MRFASIVLAFVVVGALVIFQATKSGASPVHIPSEILAAKDTTIPRVRVAGRVADKPVEYITSPEAKLSFSVEDPKHPEHGSIPVVYRGVRPDMFMVGRDVIIDGSYENGTLTAASLLTQCPSKYQAPDPDKQYRETQTAP